MLPTPPYAERPFPKHHFRAKHEPFEEGTIDVDWKDKPVSGMRERRDKGRCRAF